MVLPIGCFLLGLAYLSMLEASLRELSESLLLALIKDPESKDPLLEDSLILLIVCPV